MRCVKKDESAWSLLNKIAGDYIESVELKPVATEVAKECASSPNFIVTAGWALRNKGLFEWNDSLQQ